MPIAVAKSAARRFGCFFKASEEVFTLS